MRLFLLCYTFLYWQLSFAATEYLLNPHVTFVTEIGDPISTVYQRLTGNCWQMKFSQFKILKRSGTKLLRYGKVVKSNNWTRTYSLYVAEHLISKHQAYFNLGSIFDSLKKFDVQDNEGKVIGYIEGNFFTNNAAEFLFYNNEGEVFAIADFNSEWSSLVIRNISGEPIYTCNKHFHFNYEGMDLLSYFSSTEKFSHPDEYYWIIRKEDNLDFDSRFFWPFICFIAEVWWPGQTE